MYRVVTRYKSKEQIKIPACAFGLSQLRNQQRKSHLRVFTTVFLLSRLIYSLFAIDRMINYKLAPIAEISRDDKFSAFHRQVTRLINRDR